MIATFAARTRLRAQPTTASATLQIIDVGTIGTLLSDSPVKRVGMDWWRMRVPDGVEGWAAQRFGSVDLFVISEPPSELDRFTDIELLALMVAGEADNQPLAGRVAVIMVPLERVRLQRNHYGLTLRAVLRKPFQFSTFNGDHWRQFTARIGAHIQLAELAIDHLLLSPFPSATHYLRYDLVPMPTWTHERYTVKLGRINDHIFFKEK